MKSAFAIASALVAVSSAAPSKVLQARSAQICGQWDSVETGTYTVYQDLWNQDAGTGSQCTTINGLSGSTLSWSTSWSWSGGSNQVKSYANAVATMADTQLSAIAKLPTTWDWSYSGSSIVADVAYDAFTSSTAGGSNEYEIMIWLAALGGAGPISSTGKAVATPTIGGVQWSLYSGPNGDTTVYSFVAASEQTSYSGDLRAFFTYLISNEGFPSSQFLTSVGAGTEPFTGSDAVFSVSAFSLSMTAGTEAATKATTAATTAVATTAKAAATNTASSSAVAARYAQCGGTGFTGPTTCASGSTCTYSNPYYSQCL